jgi:type I restriction enzyme S subunit
MKFREVTIEKVVSKCITWNPIRNGDDTFAYIDLSSVDNDYKSIFSVERYLCIDAPSRARQIVKAGDVLVATVRPNLNCVALVGYQHDGMTASTGFCVLRPKRELLNSEFLFHWVKTKVFVQRMVDLATGANYPAVSDTKVKSSTIPLPPLPEQKRIASILDAVDAIRTKRRESLAQLDALLQSTFFDMFGDPISNPRKWKTCFLEEVVHKITDGTHKTPKYTESGIEFLSAKDLKDGEIKWNSGKFISLKEHELLVKRCNPELGDILLAKSGSLGSVAIINKNHAVSLFESLCLIKHDREKIEALFLTSMIRNPRMQTHLIGKNKGIAIKHLHLVDIRKLKILSPPLDLQTRFATIVEAVEKQKDRLRAHLAELDTLFASLQHRAFNGEL